VLKGLGKNYLVESYRRDGIERYTRYIEFYALRELYREVDRQVKAGESLEAIAPTLLTESSKNRQWKHARAIFANEKELSNLSVANGLKRFADERLALEQQIVKEFGRQTAAFAQVLGVSAEGVLPAADADKFIKSFRKETKQITDRVTALTQPPTQAGAEQVVGPAATGVMPGRPQVLLPPTRGTVVPIGPLADHLPEGTVVQDKVQMPIPALEQATGAEQPNDSVWHGPLWDVDPRATAPFPARLAALEKELDVQLSQRTRVGTDLYAPIFIDPTGLAVGVTLQFAQSQDGRRDMPQRFVVANESQEEVLKDLLAGHRHADIIRAWEHGGMDGAIEFAESRLANEGFLAWPVRDLPMDAAGLLAEIEELSTLLEAGDYDPVFASRLAQKVFDLFV
jgi:hypothetical protein